MYSILPQFTGGKLLSKGAYGCVFTPPLRCKINNNISSAPISNSTTDNMISKILTKNEAVLESSITQRITHIPLWKNYFVVSESVCKTPAPRTGQLEEDIDKCSMLKGKRLDSFSLLTMQFGGIPLSMYKFNLHTFSLFDFVSHLLEAVSLLTVYGITHRDLHDNNILVDKNGVPRIIDFNVSIDTTRPIRVNEIRHVANFTIYQESPDSALINAVAEGIHVNTVIHRIAQSRIFDIFESTLDIDRHMIKEQLYDYYNTSKYVQAGDDAKWLSVYWTKQDSWSIGIILLQMITKLSLWPEFVKSNQYKDNKDILFAIIHGLCQINPRSRITCIEALAKFNPESDILKIKGVNKWLPTTQSKSLPSVK